MLRVLQQAAIDRRHDLLADKPRHRLAGGPENGRAASQQRVRRACGLEVQLDEIARAEAVSFEQRGGVAERCGFAVRATELARWQPLELGSDGADQAVVGGLLTTREAIDQPADRLGAAGDRERGRVGFDQRTDRGLGEHFDGVGHGRPIQVIKRNRRMTDSESPDNSRVFVSKVSGTRGMLLLRPEQPLRRLRSRCGLQHNAHSQRPGPWDIMCHLCPSMCHRRG